MEADRAKKKEVYQPELKKLRTIRRHQNLEAAIEARQNDPALRAMFEAVIPVGTTRRYTPKFVTDIFGCRVPNDENARTRDNEEARKLGALIAQVKEKMKQAKEERENNEEE